MSSAAPTPRRTRSDFLFDPVSPASLGLFRVAFCLLLFWQLGRFEPYVTQTLVRSRFFLTYDGFHWVYILPQAWLVTLFHTLRVAALAAAAGILFRPAMILLWIGQAYVLLLCRGHFNDHNYLFVLASFLLSWTSADAWLSLRNVVGQRRSALQPVPYWQVFVPKVQFALVYFFAGIAKLTPDWLHGFPMKIWLARRASEPLVGSLFATDLPAYLLSYGGLAFDLSIGFLLLAKRTRRWALVPLVVFHLSNSLMWNIGLFPWLMLAATVLYFDPDWPERALAKLSRRSVRTLAGPPPVARIRRTVVVAGVVAYLGWQSLFPLRHWLYPGPPEWNGLGYCFAWRMLLVDRADAVRIRVEVPGKGTVGYVKLEDYINELQFAKMTRMPKSFVRFAHFLRDEMERNAGITDARIYVDVKRQMNARPLQPLIDPNLDLAAVEYHQFGPAEYILPLADVPPGSVPGWREHEIERGRRDRRAHRQER